MDQPLPASMIASLERGEFAVRPSSEVRIGDIVRRGLLVCSPSTPLYEAARRMHEARVSSILVEEAGRMIGIWTERDAISIDFSHPGLFERPVSDFMSSPVRAVTEEVSLQALAVRFRDEHVRHYLVEDAVGAPVGIVSQTDVVLNQGIEHYLRLRQVESVIKSGLVTFPPDTPLNDVARIMRERATDAVVIAYPQGDFGIITERDLARFVAERRNQQPAGEVASRPLMTIDEHASLYHARSMLVERGVRHLGVVGADGRLIDLIGFSDILSGMELVYVQELRLALEQRDQALTASQQNLRLAEKIIETSFEGVIVADSRRRIQSVNPAFTRLTGYSADEVLGQSPAVLQSGRHGPEFYASMWATIAREGRWQGEVWNRRKNGEIYPELLTITAIADPSGEVTNYVAVFSDISRLKEDEARIRHMAYFDPLTGLPNRRLLEDRIKVAIAHAHRNRGQIALLFIDLDGFKAVNDQLGHDAGDELLAATARRLSACLREDDTAARLGGDEFVVLLSDVEGAGSARCVACRLLQAVREPVEAGGQALTVTMSIGISVYPHDGTTVEALLKAADVAMYRAKSAGRNQYVIHRPGLEEGGAGDPMDEAPPAGGAKDGEA